MFGDRGLGFENSDVIEDEWNKYVQDKNKVDLSWRHFFDTWEKGSPYSKSGKDIRVFNLIEAYRKHGHLMAHTNPIALTPTNPPDFLDIVAFGFSTKELENSFDTFNLLPEKEAALSEIIEAMHAIYCNKIGFEYRGGQHKELEEFIQKEIEPYQGKWPITKEEKVEILQQLVKAETLESFLHTKFVGQKRFSLEGEETLVPLLSTCINVGADSGVLEFVIGMSHRGRLNVLSSILHKPNEEILSEFDESNVVSDERSGDVKYHKGYFAKISTDSGKVVSIDLSPNPSHLEAVDPVVEGMAKAKMVKLQSDDSIKKVMPLLIHGDAALAGQGIVYETMQFYNLEGYSTGGTLHIVINNHIGFTTVPKDIYSTYYCTDIVKTFGFPVFHVNAEDPEGCVFAAKLALKIRQQFHCDVVIDLNGYRKYGHNETDEPAFTQPLEYLQIRKKEAILSIYAHDLIREGIIEKKEFEAFLQQAKQAWQEAFQNKHEVPKGEEKTQNTNTPIKTAVSKEMLLHAAEQFTKIPEGFSIHPKLGALVKERLNILLSDKPMDWGLVETLAYASLLLEGRHVRISGQDCCRGTFSHRHAIWVDQVKEQSYFPLQHLSETQGLFTIYNSPLSEAAVLGFEFGYSVSYEEALVIWEAQFGDFSNGAQVIIDQFIVPSEEKWGVKSSIVLYLPHGYEGQGPEHSSARVERILTLAGHHNIRVVNPTTPAQLFHLLRRQVLDPVRKPLIIFTPKGLLRDPLCTSRLQDLTTGHFEEILDDPNAKKEVKKLVFCSGRIYYDIVKKTKQEDMALIRIEQLYPLDKELLKRVVEKYKGVEEFIFAQEEPSNMGPWEYLRAPLESIVSTNITFVGRARSASTAVGSHAIHNQELEAILKSIEVL